MNFIFFWRLVQEKGFDLIIRAIASFDELPGNFFIFGDGAMRSDLFSVFSGKPIFEDCSEWSEKEILAIIPNSSSPHPNPLPEGEGTNNETITPPLPLGEGPGVRANEFKIYFFSWQSREQVIDRFLSISHFSLMPSRFLETFGLSALESLSVGVPVIGFKKGWLVPFITDGLSISFSDSDEENIENLSKKIREVSERCEWQELKENAHKTASKYSEDRWMDEVRSFLPEGTKKILIVSDYIAPLGGIETHVATVVSTLRKHGYEVETFGWKIQKNRFTKILRYLGLVISGYNLPFALKLRKKIREEKPDVIWLHAVSRFLGPLIVQEATRSGAFTCITYHDLGMWTPFPSSMEREEDVPNEWNFGRFVSMAKSWNIVTHAAMFFKFVWLSFLRSAIQRVDIHLIPSEFMRRYVRDISGIPDERIVTLEHFIR